MMDNPNRWSKAKKLARIEELIDIIAASYVKDFIEHPEYRSPHFKWERFHSSFNTVVALNARVSAEFSSGHSKDEPIALYAPKYAKVALRREVIKAGLI